MHTPIRIAVLWHDTVTSEILTRRPVRVGEDLKCDLVLPDVAGIGASHTLLTPDDEGGWVLRPTAEMRGVIERAGQGSDLEADRPTVLTDGDWGQLDLGAVGIFFRIGAEPARLPTGAMLTAIEAPMLGSMLGALTVHLGILIAAFLLFDEKPVLTHLDPDDRVVQLSMELPQREIEDEMEVESLTEEVAKKAPGPEKKFGNAEETKQPKLRETPSKLVQGVRSKSALLRNLESGILQNVMGRKDSLVTKLEDAMTGAGDEKPIVQGGPGFSMRGLRGPGGGGFGEGGVIGGTGLGFETGRGIKTRSKLHKRTARRPTVKPQKPELIGGGFCKPKDIQRVVKARARGIKYCYEKELKTKPEMSGKLMVSWRIGLDGKVMKPRVESNTLGSKKVAGCVTRSIQRWRFPPPEGGMCQVRYPFVFSAGL